jgi:two-component system response regulator MprA
MWASLLARAGPGVDSVLILVVEDDDATRISLAELLETEGFRASMAANGVEAIESIARERPALILLDLHMPRLNGVGMANTMKQLGWDIPIILMSGDDELERYGREISAVATLKKPYDLDRVLARVRAVLRVA